MNAQVELDLAFALGARGGPEQFDGLIGALGALAASDDEDALTLARRGLVEAFGEQYSTVWDEAEDVAELAERVLRLRARVALLS